MVTDVRREGGDFIVRVETEGADGKLAPIHTMALRADGLYMLDEVGKAYSPPVCMVRLPVKVGDRWDGATTRSDLGPIRFVHEVKGVQKIETPAGTFEAVGIESEWVIGGARTGEKHVHWYAPGTGLIQIDKSRTLKSFTAGKE